MKFRVYEVDNELNILLDSVIKLTNEFYMEKTGRCVENNFTFRCVDPRRFFANDLATHPYCIWQYLYVNKRIQYVYSGKW